MLRNAAELLHDDNVSEASNSSTESLPEIKVKETETTPPAPPVKKNKKHKHTCCEGTRLRPLAYLIPFTNAAVDASTSLVGLRGQPPLFQWSVTGFSFLQSLGANLQFTLKNIDKAWHIVKTKKKPSNWPTVTKNRGYAAIATTVLLTIYVASTDAIQAYYFANQIPRDWSDVNQTALKDTWWIPSSALAAITAVSVVLSTSFTSYKFMLGALSNKKFDYTNRLSQCVSPSISYTLGVFSALNDVVASFSAMRITFNIQNHHRLWVLAAISSLNGFSDFFMYSKYTRNEIDSFIKHLSESRTSLKQATAFLLSTAGSGLIAYTYIQVMQNFHELNMKDFDVPEEAHSYIDPVTSTSNVLGAASYFMSGTATSYPLMLGVCDKISSAMSCMMDGVYALAKKCGRTRTLEDPITPLMLEAGVDPKVRYDDSSDSDESDEQEFFDADEDIFFDAEESEPKSPLTPKNQ